MIRGIVRDVGRLMKIAGEAKPALIACVVMHGAVRALSTWMVANLLGEGMDAVRQSDIPGLWNAVFKSVPLLLLIMALSALTSWLNGYATVKGTEQLGRRLMEAQLASPLQDAANLHSGARLSLYVNDAPGAMEGLITALAIPAGAAIMGVAGLVYVLLVHPQMALVALSIGVFTYVYSILFAGSLHRVAVKVQRLMAEMEVKLKDVLDGMVTVRLFGMGSSMERQMDEISRNMQKEGTRWAQLSGLLGGINNATSYLTDHVLVFAAGLLFLGGGIGFSELIKVSQMAGGIVGVFHVSRILIGVQKSLAGAERVFDALDNARIEETGDTAMGHGETAIHFEGVEFAYPGGARVLRGVSFKIKRGETVALVGMSGDGKSTALRLMQGLYRPRSGRVEILGVPIDQWDMEALRRVTALVPQEPVLFPGTIAENISMGVGVSDMAKVTEAAIAAGADGFIREMPKGYKETVAERGDSLSGGQRQRIAIARALYRGAEILLLDEATSAMDGASEAAIHETLSKLHGEKTIVMVTHRASALKLADRTLKLRTNGDT